MTDNTQLTYTQASNELDAIVKKLQSTDCSIDELSKLTVRAKELLDFCKKKLTETDVELKKILADLTEEPSK